MVEVPVNEVTMDETAIEVPAIEIIDENEKYRSLSLNEEVNANDLEVIYIEFLPKEDFETINKLLSDKASERFIDKKIDFEDHNYLSYDSPAPFYLDSIASVSYQSDNIISVRIFESEYGGGAHPNSWSFAYNFDVQTGELITFEDVFKQNSNWIEFVGSYLIEEIAKDVYDIDSSNFEGSEDIESWITSGVILSLMSQEDLNNEVLMDEYRDKSINELSEWHDPSLGIVDSFSFTKEGLFFPFDPYQVASYADGFVEVTIPYDKVRKYLAKDIKKKLRL